MGPTASTVRATGLVIFAIALVWPLPSVAAACSVPSVAHPDIQTAVDDTGCDQIVIAAGTFSESVVIGRSVVIQGAGSGETFILGGVEVQAGTVSVTGCHLSAAGEALWSHSGAEVSALDVVAVRGAFDPPLFADGFDDGTTDAWSGAVP